MIKFKRYPHVRALIAHYANSLNNQKVTELLETGVTNRDEAYILCKFAIKTIDCMAGDFQNGVTVLGSKDNTSMIPDIDYEISLYLANLGMDEIWESVCNES